jgi:hypothetical protein
VSFLDIGQGGATLVQHGEHALLVDTGPSGGAVVRRVPEATLGHANLGTTSTYLQGFDTEEIIATVHGRRAPMMFATAGLQL